MGLLIEFQLAAFGTGGAVAPLTYNADGNWSARLVQASGPLGEVTVVIGQQVAAVDFGLGVFAQITLGEIFNLEGSLGPFTLGGIPVNSEPQTHPLSGTASFANDSWEVTFAPNEPGWPSG